MNTEVSRSENNEVELLFDAKEASYGKVELPSNNSKARLVFEWRKVGKLPNGQTRFSYKLGIVAAFRGNSLTGSYFQVNGLKRTFSTYLSQGSYVVYQQLHTMSQDLVANSNGMFTFKVDANWVVNGYMTTNQGMTQVSNLTGKQTLSVPE